MFILDATGVICFKFLSLSIKDQMTDRQNIDEAMQKDYFDKFGITGDTDEEEGELDVEANKLYEWTQGLSINDTFITTPKSMHAL